MFYENFTNVLKLWDPYKFFWVFDSWKLNSRRFTPTFFYHVNYIINRYGLPVNFQAILIHPNKKNQKRLRDVLNQLYGHLDGSAAGSSNSADVSNLFLIIILLIAFGLLRKKLIVFWFFTLYLFAECRYTRLRIWSIRILSICVL